MLNSDSHKILASCNTLICTSSVLAMKKVFIFAYCDSVVTTATVWYHVLVGESAKDKAAYQQIMSMSAKSTNYFFAKNSLQVAKFIEAIAKSLSVPRVDLLRHQFVNVGKLLSFLRNCPPTLLNSSVQFR